MKYLKLYNEAIHNIDDLNELASFCNNYLASLVDEGFIIDVKNGTNQDRYRQDATKTLIYFKKSDYKMFKWSDIKYDFIPFISMLDKSYDIENIYFIDVQWEYISLKDILKDKIPKDFKNIRTIGIIVDHKGANDIKIPGINIINKIKKFLSF